MMIITDTREQIPYLFEGYDVETEAGNLPTGDYSIKGYKSKVAIERKSLDDFISCLMGKNRARFERELTRAMSYNTFAVVVEAEFLQVARGHYRSRMKPHAVLQTISAFYVRYGVPFLFCGNRAGSEYITHSILSKYLAKSNPTEVAV